MPNRVKFDPFAKKELVHFRLNPAIVNLLRELGQESGQGMTAALNFLLREMLKGLIPEAAFVSRYKHNAKIDPLLNVRRAFAKRIKF